MDTGGLPRRRLSGRERGVKPANMFGGGVTGGTTTFALDGLLSFVASLMNDGDGGGAASTAPSADRCCPDDGLDSVMEGGTVDFRRPSRPEYHLSFTGDVVTSEEEGDPLCEYCRTNKTMAKVISKALLSYRRFR